MDAALLPVKHLGRAKRRLAPELDAGQRREVAGALLEDALDLCGAAGFLEWLVVSDDPQVLSVASARGLETLEDPGAGLNPALELGIEHLGAGGARSLTVLPVDVPLATAEDLRDILDTGATSVALPAAEARRLGIDYRRGDPGYVQVADGRRVKGFICEAWALEDATDITEFGGWRDYLASVKGA